jgi:hypothetical protein
MVGNQGIGNAKYFNVLCVRHLPMYRSHDCCLSMPAIIVVNTSNYRNSSGFDQSIEGKTALCRRDMQG